MASPLEEYLATRQDPEGGPVPLPRPRPPGAPAPSPLSEYLASRPSLAPKELSPLEEYKSVRDGQIANPPTSPDPPAAPAPTEDPGFGQVTKDALSAGLSEANRQDAIIRSSVKSLLSGKGFGPDPGEVKLDPEPIPPSVKQQMDRPVTEGWTDPKWWASRIGYGITSGLPAVGGGIAGMAAGGLPGGMVGAGLTGGSFSLYPNYRSALQRGLSSEDAAREAIKVSALTAGTEAAAWGAFGIPLLGTAARETAAGVVADVMKHPFLEALTQIGAVQPGISATSKYAESLITGKPYTPIEFATDWVTGVGTGAFQLGAFHGAGAALGRMGTELKMARLRGMTDEQLMELYGRMIEPHLGPLSVPSTTRITELIDRHPLDKRPASDWLADFRETVPERDLYNLIPKWAMDSNGDVSKANLREGLQDRNTVWEELPLQGKPERDVGFFSPGENIVTDPTDRSLAFTVRLLDSTDANGRRTVGLADLVSHVPDAFSPGGVASFFRYLADSGISRVVYDRAMTGPTFEKFADHLGLDTGMVPATGGKPGQVFHYVDIDARANTDFGFPTPPDPRPKGKVSLQYVAATPSPQAGPNIFRGGQYLPSELRPAARRIMRMMEDWHSRFGLTFPISYRWHEKTPAGTSRGTHGEAEPLNDRTILHVFGEQMVDPPSIYEVFSHEFGHALVFDKMRRLPAAELDAILKQYGHGYTGYEKGFRTEMERNDPARLAELDKDHQAYSDALADYAHNQRLLKDAGVLRDPAVKSFWWAKKYYGNDTFQADWYWSDFQEWIANQVARWATTDERPLSQIDHTFSAMGRQIREINEWMTKQEGVSFDSKQSIQNWVNSFVGQNPWNFQKLISEGQRDGMMANRAALIAAGGSGNGAVPPTGVTPGGRNILSKFGNRLLGGSFAADADRTNRFWDLTLNLTQTALRNPTVRGLLMYRGGVKLRDQMIKSTWDRFFTGMKMWERLGPEQGEALANLWYDYVLQVYRSQAEVQKGVLRMPSAAEFQQLVQKNKVGAEAMKLFEKQKGDFAYILERAKELKRQEILKIDEPARQAKELENLDLRFQRMANIPYWPMTRFGNYTFKVMDPSGNRIRFETGESQAAIDRIEAEWQRTKLPGETSKRGILPPEAQPFFGLPPDLIDRISARGVPKDILDDLRMDYSPVNSFAHRFRHRERVPGWSMDFKRVYANYGMTSSKWLANLEMAPTLRAMIDEVRESANTLPKDATGVQDALARERLSDYMANHFKELMDPTQDIAWLRGGLFHWYLGLAPAKALVNLSQLLIGSYPFLAAHHGDLNAVRALAKAGVDIRNLYKSGHYENAIEPKMRAIAEGIRQSTLTEGQAVALAAMQNYDNLAPMATARGSAAAILKRMGEVSSFLFDTSEKYNRRVTFSAAWDLAMANPEAAGVRHAREFNPLQFEMLKERGWTEGETNAFLYAQHAVDQTQYVYAPYERPRIFRGKLGSLFAFKNFTQNTLFLLGHYPGVRMRSLLMLGLMGGVMGLPGAEDISGLLKGLAYQIFGKDFDLEEKVRRFTKDLTEGTVDPDLILHGMSRHGFGIPQLASLMGLDSGRAYSDQPGKTWRGFDLSSSIGMGRIAPVDVGALMRPTKDKIAPLEKAMEQALGPGFGFPLVAYRTLFSSRYSPTDYKRWEPIMPLGLRDASQSWRWYSEGMEKNAQGVPILRFDSSEPIHMAEIIGKSMGFNPARLTEQYDMMRDEGEAIAKMEIEQQMLLNQFGRAVMTRDAEGRKKIISAIRDFNKNLPKEAKMYTITPETLEKSVTTRMTGAARREQGLPLHDRNIPISRDIRSLHPGASIVGRKQVQ